MQADCGFQQSCSSISSACKTAARRKKKVACLVMDAAHAPHDAHIAIGVSAIQLILVVQVDADSDGFLRAFCPLQYLQKTCSSEQAACLKVLLHIR